MFKTEHLHLRAIKPADKEFLLSLYNNSTIAPLVCDDYIVPRNEKYGDQLYSRAESALMFCMIDLLEDPKKTIGFIGLMNPPDARNRCALLHIIIHPEHWGKGYGTEAIKFVVDYSFGPLVQHRLEVEIFENNERALRLYKTAGLVEEIRKRQALYFEGSWIDVLSYSILDEEWKEKQKSKNEVVPNA